MELNRSRKLGSKAEFLAWKVILFVHNYRWARKRGGTGAGHVNTGGGKGPEGIGRKGDCWKTSLQQC